MCKSITESVRICGADASVKVIVIKSVSPKAFSAGGDIKSIVAGGDDRQLQAEVAARQFEAEGIMIHTVATSSTPVVSLIDGIALGCGAGLAVHSKHTVITEKASLAMPECDVGLFPDVGASFFLPPLPNHLGMYAGLTGHRFTSDELINTGLVNEHVRSTSLPQIESALENVDDFASVGDILSTFAAAPMEAQPGGLLQHAKHIDACFSLGSVEEIVLALQAQQTQEHAEWSTSVLKVLASKSPTSLKIAHRALTMGEHMDLKSCLALDFRLMTNIIDPATGSRDFQEGVRALLIEKTKDPKWKPASLEQLSAEGLDHFFRECPKELVLP
jgi:enoyl-CoA hydratase/carnithine racemase